MSRVLQVHTNTGWEEGWAGSLRQEPDLEVHSIAYTSESAFLDEVTQFQPNVILLNKDGPLHPYPLRQWLARIPAQSRVRIIVFNAHNNVIDIYDSFKTRQAVLTDFIDLIQYIRDVRHG